MNVLSNLCTIIRFLMYATIVILTFGCAKEVISVEQESEYSWKHINAFIHGNAIQTNSCSDGEELYTLGTINFSTLRIDTEDTEEVEVEHAILYFDYLIEKKMPMSPDLWVGMTGQSVGFYNTKYPFPNHGITLYMEDLDPLFAYLETPSRALGEYLGLNSNNQCLVPYVQYQDSEKEVLATEPEYFLIDLTLVDDILAQRVDTLSCGKIVKEEDWGSIVYHTFNRGVLFSFV